uniref:Uncharacterized protein n=1 Tax=viral metagenome TaxID=1070528 RepID=A0A6M3IEK7_9ZZZZ
MRAFSLVFFQQQNPNPITVAGAIYDTFNPLCAACCDYRLDLETIMHDWRDCWYHMGCEGDFDASLAEWDVRYNASEAVT